MSWESGRETVQVAGVLGIGAGDRIGRGCLGNRGGRPYRSRLYLESGREILRFENEIRRLNTTWRPKNFPQNNRPARGVWGPQSLFPNCGGRCADARLIICSRDGRLRHGSNGLRLLWRGPRVRLILTAHGNNRWNNHTLDLRRRNFRGLLQYHDLLCLLPPGAEFRFGEGPH